MKFSAKMNVKQYNILAVDDHPVVLEGIRMVESRIEGVHCMGLTGVDALRKTLRNETYDLYILDLEFPDAYGFCVIESIRREKPGSRILIYTMHEEPWVLARLANLDIDGMVSKHADTSELFEAVKKVKDGGTFFNEDFLELAKKGEPVSGGNGNAFKLSGREREVLRCLAHGMKTAEIADSLCLSSNTIQTYRKRLMAKLDARNVADLVAKGGYLL